MIKRKRTNNDLLNTTHKTKDCEPRTPTKTVGELRFSLRVCSSSATRDSRRVTLVTSQVISHDWGKDRIVTMLSMSIFHSFIVEVKNKRHKSSF